MTFRPLRQPRTRSEKTKGYSSAVRVGGTVPIMQHSKDVLQRFHHRHIVVLGHIFAFHLGGVLVAAENNSSMFVCFCLSVTGTGTAHSCERLQRAVIAENHLIGDWKLPCTFSNTHTWIITTENRHGIACQRLTDDKEVAGSRRFWLCAAAVDSVLIERGHGTPGYRGYNRLCLHLHS